MKNKKSSQDKTDLAKNIAKRKIAFREAFESLEKSLKRIFVFLSGAVDKFIFSKKYDKIISLFLAALLYMMLNFSNTGLLALDSTYTIKSHEVTLNADLDVYEVVGFDKNVDVILTGKKSSDVNAAKAQGNTKVVLDLAGLQTGEHTVKFVPINFSNRVSVRTQPESATIIIRKKETTKFTITHDYLNLNKMDEKYFPGEPEFESTEVLVRASSKTTETIAYVKALIDVANATEDFSVEAPIFAYNVNGEKIDVDLIPKIVKVKVPITSPSKSVPIRIVPSGIIPNDKAIESITLDHSSITLYGKQSALDATDEVRINIDASKIDKDLKTFENIVLPSGIRQASVNKVNLDIKLAEKKSKTLKNIPISFENNIHGYKTRLDDPDQAEVDITIYGSEKVLELVDEENFGKVYFDMIDLKPSKVTLSLLVSPNNPFITYKLEFEEISMEIVGD